MKNSLYWAYNLPLQVFPHHAIAEDDNSPIVGATILNYMPRKERCIHLDLAEVLGDQTETEFFECAAIRLENLARLMREYAARKVGIVYYPDDGLEEK